MCFLPELLQYLDNTLSSDVTKHADDGSEGCPGDLSNFSIISSIVFFGQLLIIRWVRQFRDLCPSHSCRLYHSFYCFFHENHHFSKFRPNLLPSISDQTERADDVILTEVAVTLLQYFIPDCNQYHVNTGLSDCNLRYLFIFVFYLFIFLNLYFTSKFRI